MFARRSKQTILLILTVIITLLISLSPATLGQEAGTEVLTLEQAVILALGHNREVKNATIEVEKYSDKLAVIRTKRLPEFKVSALPSMLLTPMSYTFEKGTFGTYGDIGPIPDKTVEITTPRRPTYFVSGQVTQPLSQLFRINLNLKQASVGQQIAEQQLRLQRQTIINNVRRSYYSLLQTQSSLRASEESIRLYQELDRVTGEYVAQQVALKADGLEVRMRLEKAKYDTQNLSDQLATQKEQFNQLLGRDVQVEFSVAPVPALSGYEVNLAAARDLALEQRPEIKDAQLKVKYAQYDRKIKKSEAIPEIGLAFNYVSPFNTNFVPKNVASVLRTDPDRANLAGISNYDVANASATAISGRSMTTLREGDKQIPVVARLRMEERAQLADINNLYVYSSQNEAPGLKTIDDAVEIRRRVLMAFELAAG